jgi:hypothetical protein
LKLVDEMIASAVDGSKPIADLLRKCLVLAYDLQNEKLKGWVEKELNGYEREGELPAYREITVVSKGTFAGPLGARQTRPIPSLILKPEHRDLVDTAKFGQPIAAYDATGDRKIENAVINWPHCEIRATNCGV